MFRLLPAAVYVFVFVVFVVCFFVLLCRTYINAKRNEINFCILSSRSDGVLMFEVPFECTLECLKVCNSTQSKCFINLNF